MPKKDMTVAWVKSVRYDGPKDREDWFDTGTCLVLRVYASGSKKWHAYFREAGTQRRPLLGETSTLSLADARAKASESKLNASRKSDIPTSKGEPKAVPTFESVAAQSIDEYAKIYKRSWAEDERRLRLFIIPTIGHRLINEVTRFELYALVRDVMNRKLKAQKNIARHAEAKTAPIQANRCLAVIKTVMNFAVDKEYIAITPAFRMTPPGVEQSRERWLTPGEIRSVWAAFDTLDPMMAAMFKLRLITAQRGGEVESMRWSDLDFDEAVWTIPSEVAKNNISHRVPLSNPAFALIRERRAACDDAIWVFPSPTRRGQHVSNIQKAAKRVVAKSGVTFTMHDLRRTAATHMRRIKIDREDVSRVLNHFKKDVTATYDRHSYDDEKRDALDRWAACLTAMLAIPMTATPNLSESGAEAILPATVAR